MARGEWLLFLDADDSLFPDALAGGPVSAQSSWRVDVSGSHLVVHVYAAGLLSPVLHDHHLVPERWSGTVDFATARLPEMGLTIAVGKITYTRNNAVFAIEAAVRRRQNVPNRSAGPAFLLGNNFPQGRS